MRRIVAVADHDGAAGSFGYLDDDPVEGRDACKPIGVRNRIEDVAATDQMRGITGC